MGRLLLLLIALAVPAHAQDDLKPYKCRPLEFELGIPPDWTAEQDLTGMVASTRDLGFMVSREPFLGIEKQFAKAWDKQLQAAEISTRVKMTRAGPYTAYRADWAAETAGRFIEVWRVYVPVNEMLYNFSFSAKNLEDLGPLVKKVLRSFKVTAKPPSMKFQTEEVSLAPRAGFRAPVGYVKAVRGVRLGGGLSRGFTRRLPGYAKPHIAGVIALNMKRGQTKKLVAAPWAKDSGTFGKVLKKPRTRGAKFNGIKGHSLVATVLTKGGAPKRYMVFAGKLRQVVVLVTVVVDAREARMYGDYLKLVCSQIRIAK